MSKKLFRAVAIVAGLSFAGQACAHADLVSSRPAADTEVAPPGVLELTFSEGVNLPLSSVVLSDADGEAIATEPPALLPGDKGMSIAIRQPLQPGNYKVTWDVLSVDGHKIGGSYRFTVAP